MKKGREEKTKFSKFLPNNQIITSCCIELQVQEMTMNEKLTMIALTLTDIDCGFFVNFSVVDLVKAHLISSNAT